MPPLIARKKSFQGQQPLKSTALATLIFLHPSWEKNGDTCKHHNGKASPKPLQLPFLSVFQRCQ